MPWLLIPPSPPHNQAALPAPGDWIALPKSVSVTALSQQQRHAHPSLAKPRKIHLWHPAFPAGAWVSSRAPGGADLQQIVSPSLHSKGIFAPSPPQASLANLQELFAHPCLHGTISSNARGTGAGMTQNRPLCAQCSVGFLWSWGKFLIALTIDNLSLGICSALRSTGAKNARSCSPECLETSRESKSGKWEGHGEMWSSRGTASTKQGGEKERNVGLLEAHCLGWRSIVVLGSTT